jgi:peptidoglycan/LPS O-acetylase OafA/YrhL
MTHETTDVLRRSLDQVDRERKRAKLLLFGLLAMTVAFWIAMILAKDDHAGLPFGLAAVMGSVYVAAMIAAKASHDNTRTILKAIELLSKDKQNG